MIFVVIKQDRFERMLKQFFIFLTECPYKDMVSVRINGVNDTCEGHMDRLTAHTVCGSEVLYWCCQTCSRIRNLDDLGKVSGKVYI